ncbi:MAG: oligosaccharide flippase family protein [Bacteroidaceae bacterium]|nr:oligosaccharide flippase family protein [Bacteroidaceae bacterium]
MANLKSLAKDTAIYGLSSIIGRFLNYLLVPLYTTVIVAESGGYGIVSNLYAYTALFLVLLTFGMETTLFRFSNKEGEDANKVYGTALWMVLLVGIVFLALVFALLKPISQAMGYAEHPEYIGCFAVITALDAFQAIMFARLRQQHRPVKFMALKMSFIILSILLNLFVFLVMPRMFGSFPVLKDIYERFNYGVGLIFFINLFCTAVVTLGFIPELKGLTFGFDKALARRMLRYSWPLLLLGLVGILNQVCDKILYPYLVPGKEGMVQLGIYGACAKIALIMSLLTQAFRYAYEPFVFAGSRDKNSPEMLAAGMKYFIIFTLLAFLAVMFYLPILKYFVGLTYWEGLKVIPIVMMAEIFMGIYFNLSFWYKLTDQTWWGAIMSGIGAAVMIAVNVIFVPRIGYMACAWGGFAGYGTAMLLSYFIGQKKFPIQYALKDILVYTILAMALFAVSQIISQHVSSVVALIINTALFAVYLFYLIRKDLPLSSIPVINRFVKK